MGLISLCKDLNMDFFHHLQRFILLGFVLTIPLLAKENNGQDDTETNRVANDDQTNGTQAADDSLEKGGFDPFIFIVRPGKESQIIFQAYEKIVNAYIKIIQSMLKKLNDGIEKIEDQLYAENKGSEFVQNQNSPLRMEWDKLKKQSTPYKQIMADFQAFLASLKKLYRQDDSRKINGVIKKTSSDYNVALNHVSELGQKIAKDLEFNPAIAKMLFDNLPSELKRIGDVTLMDIKPEEANDREDSTTGPERVPLTGHEEDTPKVKSTEKAESEVEPEIIEHQENLQKTDNTIDHQQTDGDEPLQSATDSEEHQEPLTDVTPAMTGAKKREEAIHKDAQPYDEDVSAGDAKSKRIEQPAVQAETSEDISQEDLASIQKMSSK